MSKIKLKICEICNKEIKPNDNYCHLIDYKQGKFFCEGYYHTPCYNNQLRGLNPKQQEIQKKALDMLGNLKGMLKERGLMTEQYEIAGGEAK